MKLKVTVYPVRKLVRAAGDIALDTAAAVQEIFSIGGRRAEEVLSRLRVEREVRDIEEEIGLQMREAGELLYAKHCGETPTGEIEEIMEYVDGLHEELAAYKREKETLRGRLICPACGEANGADCLYCRNCGAPLSRG